MYYFLAEDFVSFATKKRGMFLPRAQRRGIGLLVFPLFVAPYYLLVLAAERVRRLVTI
jgi:hypothetical protein